MVMPLGHVKACCPICKWEKGYYLSSDIIIGIPQSCPKCGHSEVNILKNHSILATAHSVIMKLFR
jgi:hypothetical protein